jgi:hypothetical protein
MGKGAQRRAHVRMRVEQKRFKLLMSRAELHLLKGSATLRVGTAPRASAHPTEQQLALPQNPPALKRKRCVTS